MGYPICFFCRVILFSVTISSIKSYICGLNILIDYYMRRTLLLLQSAFVALMMVGCATTAPQTPLNTYVDPNIGTDHSRWFVYTPAAVPFGMAKLGASTNGSYSNKWGWEAVGYEDKHSTIEGFPCFHEFQIGGLMLMATTGELKTEPGKVEDASTGYRSSFDKADEYATSGYYSVVLKDYGVKAELTATERVGFQRYTFPESGESRIIFDVGNRLGESGPVETSSVKVIDNHIVEGYIATHPIYVGSYDSDPESVNMYFYAVLDKEATTVETFFRGEEAQLGTQIEGLGACVALGYSTKEGEQVNVKLGLSYTSIENAKLNMEAEAKDLGFDKAKELAIAKWNESLGRIKVSGGDEASMKKFYTGLYHALLGRGVASDVNGAYPKYGGTIGQIPCDANGKPEYHHYNTDAIWGAYWNLSILWALAYPEYYNDFVKSQMIVYRDAGWLGDGIANSRYVSGVGTNMMSIIFAGAYQSGIANFDIEEAYEAALKNELGWENRLRGAGKYDVVHFLEHGYAPHPRIVEKEVMGVECKASASHTMEYSFSAYAVAQWAKKMGKMEDYERLLHLSKGWERIFDPETEMIRPRYADGEFIPNFDPTQPWEGFQEGNAVQYTYFVPQDPVGLAGKMGVDVYNNRLDSIFTEARKSIFGGGKVVNAFSGLSSPYNHGNQPSLHISWMFNFSGKPYLTQKWTRLICDEFYGIGGEHGYGYGQDEDQGQLGAWYVMSALGLFDVQGGSSIDPTFQIGSPIFDKIEIQGAKGKMFTIKTVNGGKDNYYVQSAKLDGKDYDDCWIYRDRLYEGGELVIEMGSEPNREWGTTAPHISR